MTIATENAKGCLHRQVSWLGVLLLTLSCLSPIFSIFGLGGDVLHQAGTGAPQLFLIGIGAAVVWVALYAELGSAYPYAGGDYVGIGATAGPLAGFLCLTAWVVASGPSVALMAKTIATYVDVFVPACPAPILTFGALAAAVALALLNVRTSALVTGAFLAIEMLAVIALIGAGFLHPARGFAIITTHPMAPNALATMLPVSLGVMALSSISATSATIGGNQALNFGEEVIDPHRNVGRVVVLAGLIGAFATALPVAAVIIGAGNLGAVLHSPAPFSAFLSAIAGPWAGEALGACVALAIFNALIATVMQYGRMFFSIGRDDISIGLVNHLLAQVHRVSGVPRAATLVIGAFSALCCFLSTHLLVVLFASTTDFILPLVCLAVICGRVRRLTGQQGYWRAPLFPLVPVLGIVLAAAFIIADLLDPAAGRPSLMMIGVAMVAAVVWYELVLKPRPGGWRPRTD